MRHRANLHRSCAAALVLTLLLSAAPPPAVAAAGSPSYEHLWRVETMLGGDRGKTAKEVTRSDVTLTNRGDAIEGTILYEDRLGMQDASGTWSQGSTIELALTGAFVEADGLIGGTFEGEAILLRRSAGSLEEAVSPDIEVRSDGIQGVYAVSGYWGARFVDGHVTGELLYERAELIGTSAEEVAPAGVEWFDRAGPTTPGEPQTFSTDMKGEPIEPGEPAADGGGVPGENAARDPSSAERAGGGIWRYVARGLRGGPIDRLVPVDAEASRAARALKDARPSGATRLPSSAVAIDVDVAGAYLDALNRAAMLVADEGHAGFESLAEEWTRARRALQPAPAHEVPELASRLRDALTGQRAEGADELAVQAAGLAANRGTATAAEVSAWISVAEAVRGAGGADGDVMRGTADAVKRVRESAPRRQADRDAVLVAADSASAPETSAVLSRFAREPSSDTSAAATSSGAPGLVAVSSAGADLRWRVAGGVASARPTRWLAYRRGDGRLYWLAEPGGSVAITDGTLRGWAFETRRAWLVSPGRVGRVLAQYAAH